MRITALRVTHTHSLTHTHTHTHSLTHTLTHAHSLSHSHTHSLTQTHSFPLSCVTVCHHISTGIYRCENLTGGTNQDPCGVYTSRRNTQSVYLYIHFCSFSQITLKEGVTKETGSYEDEWPRGRLGGLRWNPMTRERSKVHHNVKERNNRRGMRKKKQIKRGGKKRNCGRSRITGKREALKERKLI